MAMVEQVGKVGRWQVLLKDGVGIRLAVLCLGLWLHAASSMLAATTLPSAVREFGGAEFMGWAFTLYLVGSITAAAATGLLARAYEIRFVMIGAAGLYMVGCIVCAIAPDMIVMLSGRLLQGVGGGFLVALMFVGLNRWFDKALLPRLLALISTVWSTSAFCGPLVGGTFSTYGHWRFAFWAFALQAALFVVLVWVLMPSEGRGSDKLSAPFPGLRLLILSLSILSVAYAGANVDLVISPLLCVLALLLLWLVFRLDAKTPAERMFPARPLHISHRVGSGLCFVAFASFATMSYVVYGPILFELLHGLTPLVAGYLIALESISWGVAAVYISRRPKVNEGAMIRTGAVLICASVLGLAVTMSDGPLWAVIISAAGQGAGFGIMWAFVVKRIMEYASEDEREIASSSIPAFQQIGFAFGAGAAGIVANAVGFADEVTVTAAQDAALWVFAAFVPFGVVSIIAAWRLTR